MEKRNQCQNYMKIYFFLKLYLQIKIIIFKSLKIPYICTNMYIFVHMSVCILHSQEKKSSHRLCMKIQKYFNDTLPLTIKV